MSLRQALMDIARAPEGPKVAAYFDFDGTLISGYSATAFAEDQLRRRAVSLPFVADMLRRRVEVALRRSEEEDLVRASIRSFAGVAEADLEETGRRLFRERIAGSVHPEARELVRAHLRRGHRVVIASSATRYQVEPMAADLGVADVLCTRLQVRGGVLTGEVRGPLLWGAGKAEAVRGHARRHRLDLAQAFAYGNGNEDVAFLEAAGNPRAVNPGAELEAVAISRRWRILRFRTRRGLDAELLARNAAGAAGIGAAVLAGLGVGLGLNRSRRQATNLITSLGSDLALPLAGVEVRVQGEENLWAARPCVFIFNHQSYLDGIVLGHLLREDVTAVAKRELLLLPGFNVVGWLADFAFIDRTDGASARDALKPVVDRLRQGTSLVIAPEGTRSPTRRVGPFKKGAFHVALQAGVPLVPVVIRNAGDLMWKNSFVARPGVVDVAVLPPISVAGWKRTELDARVEEVRELFVRTLDEWPADTPADRPAAKAAKPGPR